jgi:hypothetical protein
MFQIQQRYGSQGTGPERLGGGDPKKQRHVAGEERRDGPERHGGDGVEPAVSTGAPASGRRWEYK